MKARCNPALYYAAKQLGITSIRMKKTWFGRLEFKFLMDFDMGTSNP
jgi:hypothetical protein